MSKTQRYLNWKDYPQSSTAWAWPGTRCTRIKSTSPTVGARRVMRKSPRAGWPAPAWPCEPSPRCVWQRWNRVV
jgi:hypothetical protein